MMSDTESDVGGTESECYESEMIPTITIKKYMSYKCRECSFLKPTIDWCGGGGENSKRRIQRIILSTIFFPTATQQTENKIQNNKQTK